MRNKAARLFALIWVYNRRGRPAPDAPLKDFSKLRLRRYIPNITQCLPLPKNLPGFGPSRSGGVRVNTDRDQFTVTLLQQDISTHHPKLKETGKAC